MSDQPFSRDDKSLMSRLLAAGDRDEPSPRTVQKALIAVGVATTVSGATGVASAGTSGTVAILKWLTVGVIAGTSVTVGGGAIVDRGRDPRTDGRERVTSSSAEQPAARVKSQPTSSSSSASVAELEPLRQVEARAPDPASSSLKPSIAIPPVGPSAASSAAPDTLIAEAALIERASSAVRHRNGTLALGALRDYQSRFPRGRLYPEATVLEVEALLLLGQRDSARDIARRFLKAHPESPSAKRLRSLTGLGG